VRRLGAFLLEVVAPSPEAAPLEVGGRAACRLEVAVPFRVVVVLGACRLAEARPGVGRLAVGVVGVGTRAFACAPAGPQDVGQFGSWWACGMIVQEWG